MKFICSIFASVIFAASLAAQTKPADFAALKKTITDELAATKTPCASLAIVAGDRVIFAKGFGNVSSEGDGAAVTPDTLFRMSSTTKMFTAAALVGLADAGKLKLDAPVGNYLKNLPPNGAPGTVSFRPERTGRDRAYFS